MTASVPGTLTAFPTARMPRQAGDRHCAAKPIPPGASAGTGAARRRGCLPPSAGGDLRRSDGSPRAGDHALGLQEAQAQPRFNNATAAGTAFLTTHASSSRARWVVMIGA
jgi:hypothetical protein